MSSCGGGRNPRNGWPLRGSRGDPPRRGDAGLEVHRVDRHPARAAPAPAGGPSAGPGPQGSWPAPAVGESSRSWRNAPRTGRRGDTARSMLRCVPTGTTYQGPLWSVRCGGGICCVQRDVIASVASSPGPAKPRSRPPPTGPNQVLAGTFRRQSASSPFAAAVPPRGVEDRDLPVAVPIGQADGYRPPTRLDPAPTGAGGRGARR